MSSARDIEEVCRDGGRAVAGLGQASPPASVSYSLNQMVRTLLLDQMVRTLLQ